MRKNVFTQLSCFALMTCLPFTASAASPQTGESAASLIPWVIGLLVASIAAIIVCLFLFKKKK